MPTPDFIIQLREKIGHEQIFVPACSAIIIRDVPADAGTIVAITLCDEIGRLQNQQTL